MILAAWDFPPFLNPLVDKYNKDTVQDYQDWEEYAYDDIPDYKLEYGCYLHNDTPTASCNFITTCCTRKSEASRLPAVCCYVAAPNVQADEMGEDAILEPLSGKDRGLSKVVPAMNESDCPAANVCVRDRTASLSGSLLRRHHCVQFPAPPFLAGEVQLPSLD